jgi:hypothetical protein
VFRCTVLTIVQRQLRSSSLLKVRQRQRWTTMFVCPPGHPDEQVYVVLATANPE